MGFDGGGTISAATDSAMKPLVLLDPATRIGVGSAFMKQEALAVPLFLGERHVEKAASYRHDRMHHEGRRPLLRRVDEPAAPDLPPQYRRTFPWQSFGTE